MLLIPLGLDQSRGDQIDNLENFESKGYGRTIPEDQLTQVKLLEQLKEIENDRESIIKQMETYRESYTKEDLFNKIFKGRSINSGGADNESYKTYYFANRFHLNIWYHCILP